MATRTLTSKISPLLAAIRSPSLLRLRPLIAAGDGVLRRYVAASISSGGLRSFSSRPTTSSLNDPSPNWSNRPPKETILLEGCDFEHWLVVVDPPEPHLTRDEIIDSYIKTFAQVVGSEQDARMKMYSVSTKHYFAFGALVSEEMSYKIKALPKVRWVLPDSYLDVRNKDYGGEPFINGEAVPYDPKYHEEWVRNNQRANERSRRNDRPRNFDRSRNFERRRESMQNRDAPPMQNQAFQSGSNQPPPNQSPLQQSGAPPHAVPNHEFTNTSNSNTSPSQPPPRNVGYQIPNPSYQGAGQAYQGQGGGHAAFGQAGGQAYQGGIHGFQRGPNQPPLNQTQPPQSGVPPHPLPNREFSNMSNSNATPSQPPPPNVGYQNQIPIPSFQGGGQSYQGQGGGHAAAYQGGGHAYQGDNHAYQSGSPAYQGGNPGYQSGGPPHQSGSNYQAGNDGYQQAYQPVNNTNYSSGNPPYQARDVPGRD